MKKVLLVISIILFLSSIAFYLKNDRLTKKTVTPKSTSHGTISVGSASRKRISRKKLSTTTKRSKPSEENSFLENTENGVDPIVEIISEKEYLIELRSAYRNGEWHRVIELAKTSFPKLKEDFDGTWVYGDFLHWTNIQIGKSFLKIGNLSKAEQYLLKSVDKKLLLKTGRKQFSPHLMSFGPDRSLAYDLFKLGRVDAVRRYFERCKSFWDAGVESGVIDKALRNIKVKKSKDNYYEAEDNENFPFVRHVFSYGSFE
ncbi:MAG: hypothetical protein NXH75_00375 [Halobacteriovoraceae bacterium]|nr:hypothetical protein [Halobacteriovoraceae bacterium]